MLKTVTFPAYWFVSGNINFDGRKTAFNNHKVDGKLGEVEAIEAYRSRVAGVCKNAVGGYSITEIVTKFVPEDVVEYEDEA